MPFVLETACNHLLSEGGDAFSWVENLGKPLASSRCVQVLGEMLAGLTTGRGEPSSG
jgi:hypothetical protein